MRTSSPSVAAARLGKDVVLNDVLAFDVQSIRWCRFCPPPTARSSGRPARAILRLAIMSSSRHAASTWAPAPSFAAMQASRPGRAAVGPDTFSMSYSRTATIRAAVDQGVDWITAPAARPTASSTTSRKSIRSRRRSFRRRSPGNLSPLPLPAAGIQVKIRVFRARAGAETAVRAGLARISLLPYNDAVADAFLITLDTHRAAGCFPRHSSAWPLVIWLCRKAPTPSTAVAPVNEPLPPAGQITMPEDWGPTPRSPVQGRVRYLRSSPSQISGAREHVTGWFQQRS